MISDINSGILRIAFRIYFIVTLTLIGLIGSQCSKCAAKLELLKGRTVNLHRMTGWLRPSDIAMCIWKLGRLPGGIGLGILMLIVSVLTLTADLAVNILVYQKAEEGLCSFDYGLVMDWTANSETFIEPPPNSYPARLASNAQVFSMDNGCDIGIFRKIPWSGNSSFCANEYDIMGTWGCEAYGDEYNFDGDATPEYIANWLYNNSLQYFDWSYTEYRNGYGQPSHLAIWSSSANGDDTGSYFNVQASVDLNGTYSGPKTMKTYQCKVYSADQYDLDNINSILAQMASNSSLSQWAAGLEADLYFGDKSDINPYADVSIAERLNSMTMVQGGSNIANSTVLDSDIPFYGCIVDMTYISPAILTLIAFAGLNFLIILVYWLSLLLRLGKHALPDFLHRNGSPSHSIKPVPDSILSWMLQASRENAFGGQSAYGGGMGLAGMPRKEKELHNWGFSVVDTGSYIARMVRTRGSTAPPVEQVYVNIAQK